MDQGQDATTGEFLGLVEEVGPTVIEAMADGCTLHTAAMCAGITPQTVYEWLARADGTTPRGRDRGDERGVYKAFAMAFRRAEGGMLRAVTKRVVLGEGAERKSVVVTGEDGQSSTAAGDLCPVQAANDRFVLERRDPEWRRQDKRELDITSGPGPPTIILED